MDFSDVASYFDQSPVQDAYDPGPVIFNAQFDVYDGSTRDGMTVIRRIMSAAPSVSLPARKTVLTHNSLVLLVGNNQEDFMQGDVARRKYIVQYAAGLTQVRSAADILDVVAGTDVYTSKFWVKELKETEFSSDRFSIYDLYFTAGESLTLGFIANLDSRYYRIIGIRKSAAGFLVAETIELPLDSYASITYTPKGTEYISATDTYGDGTPVVIPAFWEYFKTNFKYYQSKQFKYEAGDVIITVSASDVANPLVGAGITTGGRGVTVIAVADDGNDSWELHCRNA